MRLEGNCEVYNDRQLLAIRPCDRINGQQRMPFFAATTAN